MEMQHTPPQLEIIAASFAAFNARGYAAVSMDEVAKGLHVSKKTIYKHFGSKEALLEAALLRLFAQVESQLAQLERQKSPKEVLLRFFAIHRDWRNACSPALRTELQTELPYLHDRIDNFERQTLLRHLIGYLKDLRDQGLIDYPSPSREFAMAFMTLMGSLSSADPAHATYLLQSISKGMGLKKKKKGK